MVCPSFMCRFKYKIGLSLVCLLTLTFASCMRRRTAATGETEDSASNARITELISVDVQAMFPHASINLQRSTQSHLFSLLLQVLSTSLSGSTCLVSGETFGGKVLVKSHHVFVWSLILRHTHETLTNMRTLVDAILGYWALRTRWSNPICELTSCWLFVFSVSMSVC